MSWGQQTKCEEKVYITGNQLLEVAQLVRASDS